MHDYARAFVASLGIIIAGLSLCSTMDLRAQSPRLLADLNQRDAGAMTSSMPGLQLQWKADGSASDSFVQAGGLSFFLANLAVTGRELWATDGTKAGTRLVRDIRPGPRSSGIRYIAPYGSLVAFAANDGVHGGELWISDGTESGTRLVADLAPGAASSDPRSMIAVGGRLLFNGPQGLWATSGSAASTQRISSVSIQTVPVLLSSGLAVYSGYEVNTGWEVWCTDGTAAGTRLLRDIRPGPANSQPNSICTYRGRVYFSADDGIHGKELWTSDGTMAGTKLVADLTPGPSSSSLKLGTASGILGTNLYFLAGPESSGSWDLWKTDGTSAGTSLVKATGIGGAGFFRASDAEFVRAGSKLIFRVWGLPWSQLWVTDGSLAGTSALKQGATPKTRMIVHGGKAYFRDGVAATGYELWESNGSIAGTRMLRDLVPGSGDSNPSSLSPVASGFLFAATGADGERELYVSDGTAAGTKLFKNLDRGLVTESAKPRSFADLDGRTTLFFAEEDQRRGLWRTDGTRVGTSRIHVNGTFTSERELVVYKGRAWFSGGASFGKHNLWVSDGTAAGTKEFFALSNSFSLNPQSFCVYRDRLYFSGNGDLWSTDGTVPGTAKVKSLNPRLLNPLAHLTVHDDKLFFTLDDQLHGAELWVSDGSSAGTKLVKDIVPGNVGSEPTQLTSFGGRLWFVIGSNQIWTSDGSAQGTLLLKDTPGNRVYELEATDEFLFVSTTSFSAGHELFRYDAGGNGPTLVADIVPGRGSIPLGLLARGKHVLFHLLSDTTGIRLWQSDGTAAGTMPIASATQPIPRSADIASKAISGGRLFFAADDGAHGQEVWVLDRPGASAVEYGSSCPPSYPTLNATAPTLGTVMRLRGRGLSSSLGLFFISPPMRPSSFGACLDYVDVTRAVYLVSTAGGPYDVGVAIPPVPILNGLLLNLQGWFLRAPASIEATNPVRLMLGS